MPSEAEEVKRHVFLISALEGSEWLASHTGQIPPTDIRWVGSKWIPGPSGGGGGDKIRCRCQESNSGRRFH